MDRLFKKTKVFNKKERVLVIIIRLFYAFVMVLAGALMLVLFEDLMPVNIYFIYLLVGIILGLSVILIISTFSESNEH